VGVKDMEETIEPLIDGWNDRGEPFVWPMTPDQILSPQEKPEH